MNYYFDTLTWRDYYENREDNLRPLGEWTFMLIKKIIERDECIYYSAIVIDELKKDYGPEMIEKVFSVVDKNLLKNVEINRKDVVEASRICKLRKVPFADALHAVLSRDNGLILVTRDKHFLELSDIAVIKKPEELI